MNAGEEKEGLVPSTPPKNMDWERLKREAGADFAAGRYVGFDTPEEMLEGLTPSAAV